MKFAGRTTTAVMPFPPNKILLIKRRTVPFSGYWALPGGRDRPEAGRFEVALDAATANPIDETVRVHELRLSPAAGCARARRGRRARAGRRAGGSQPAARTSGIAPRRAGLLLIVAGGQAALSPRAAQAGCVPGAARRSIRAGLSSQSFPFDAAAMEAIAPRK